MGIKKEIDERFRRAFIQMKRVKGGTFELLSEHCKVSVKHLQNIASEKVQSSAGSDLKKKISEYYGVNVETMLTIGKDIIEGRDPIECVLHATGNIIMPKARISGQATVGSPLNHSVQVNAENCVTTNVSLEQGEREEKKSSYMVELSPVEHEILMLARAVLSPLMLARCRENLLSEKRRQEGTL